MNCCHTKKYYPEWNNQDKKDYNYMNPFIENSKTDNLFWQKVDQWLPETESGNRGVYWAKSQWNFFAYEKCLATDCSGYMHVYIWQNSWNVSLRWVHFMHVNSIPKNKNDMQNDGSAIHSEAEFEIMQNLISCIVNTLITTHMHKHTHM